MSARACAEPPRGVTHEAPVIAKKPRQFSVGGGPAGREGVKTQGLATALDVPGLLAYVGFSKRSSARLRAVFPLIADDIPAIVEDFCAALLAHPETARALGSGSTAADSLRQSLRGWLEELLLGPHDESYFQRRMDLARTYAVSAFPQPFLLAAMNRVRVRTRAALAAALKDGGPLEATAAALDQIIDVELAVMLETYRSELARTEQEMLRRTLRAERLAAVGTLATGLAHEVRNPLNSAALQLRVLRRRLEKGERGAAALEPAAQVEEEIRRLQKLTDDFLAFARPQPIVPQPTELGALVNEVLALVAPEAREAGLVLEGELAPGLDPVEADPERMRQVLLNLIGNAIEAMAPGGTLTVRTRPGKERGTVTVDVVDTGPGFDEDDPVFDAFYTTKPGGTGLGLSIVHRIVGDHGGTVRVTSRAGETCFSVTLPVLGSAHAPLAGGASAPVARARSSGKTIPDATPAPTHEPPGEED